jgi:hypothetical protein
MNTPGEVYKLSSCSTTRYLARIAGNDDVRRVATTTYDAWLLQYVACNQDIAKPLCAIMSMMLQ